MLVKILEASIAKDLQPWVKTLNSRFYEGMFRLRGLPRDAQSAPAAFFGKPTSDIVYSQLAEGVREALRPAPRTRLHSPTVLPFHLSAFCCAIVASL